MFDKRLSLFLKKDTGSGTEILELTADNDWNQTNLGIEYYTDDSHVFLPWTSIVECYQETVKSEIKVYGTATSKIIAGTGRY